MRMPARLKKRLPYLAALLVFWLLIRILVNPFSSDKLEIAGCGQQITYGREDDREATSVLLDGDILEQRFTAARDGLCGVMLRLSVDAGSETLFGQLRADILDENGQIAATVLQDTSAWHDDELITLRFDDLSLSGGKPYTLRLTGVGQEEGACLRFLLGYSFDGTGLDDHGEMLERPVYLLTLYRRSSMLTEYYAWWGLLILLSFLFVLLADGCTPRTYLLFSLLGVLFVFVNSNYPNEFDEWTHFLKATAVSWGRPLEIVRDGVIGFDIPYDKVLPSVKGLPDWFGLPMTTQSRFIPRSYVANVLPVGYLVPAAGIAIANLLHLGQLAHMLLSRLAVYAFYTFFCTMALKKSRHWRGVLFTVAALPMAQRLAGMVSPDPMLIAPGLLFISICLKYRYDENAAAITLGDTLWMAVCMLFFCSGKYLGYAPIALTALIIPKERFRDGSHRRRVLLAGLGIILMMAVPQILLLKRFPYTEDRNGNTGLTAQLMYMLHHPGQTVWVFLRYLLDSLPDHLSGFHYNSIHTVLSSVLEIGCLASAVITPDKPSLTHKRSVRVLCFVLFAVMALFSITSLYLAFTPIGSRSIDGMQTRYFLPGLALLLLGLSMNGIRNYSRRFNDTLVFTLLLALLCNLGGNLLLAFDIVGF